MNKKIQISIKEKGKNIRTVECDNNTIAKVLFEGNANFLDIMGIRVNNEIRTLNHKLVDNAVVEPVFYSDYDGYRIYTRTARFLLYMALARCFPDLKVELCNTIANASYFITKTDITEEMVKKIQEQMVKISKESHTIERKIITVDEARSLYAQAGDEANLEQIKTKLISYVTMYFCDGLFKVMNGVLANNTNLITSFSLHKFRKGFALVYPEPTNKNKCNKKAKESKLHSIYEENDNYLELFDVRSVSDLNKKIIEGKISDVIHISEAVHKSKLEQLVNDIVARKNVKVVLIAGPSSSGKTTFAGEVGLRLRCKGYNIIPISMDNYFKEREDTPKQPNGEYDFETVDALDLKLLNEQMGMLLKGKTVEMPEFNFLTGHKEYKKNMITMKENDILVMEGIHAFNDVVSNFAKKEEKFKIYIAPMTTLNIDDFSKVSTTDTRMLRRMIRDHKTRGHSVEKTLTMWSNIMVGEEKYIYPYIEHADGIFNTSLVYEMAVLKQKAEPLLLSVPVSNVYFSETRRLYSFLSNFLSLDASCVPEDSILREFIGQ